MTTAPFSPSRQNALQGIFWMFLSGISFVGVTGIVRSLGTDIPAAQSAFIRFAWGALFLLPALVGVLKIGIPGNVWKLHLGRGALHIAAVICWFYAMARIPLAEVTAIGYLNPVLLTLGTALFLGEKLALRRIAAICVALVGALIVLRPGLREVTDGHLAQVGAAFFFASSYLFAKRLSDLVGAGQAVAVLSLVVTVGLAPFAWAVWVPVTWVQVGWLAVVAGFATSGHYCMSRAFAVAPVAVSQPVVFLQLVWATLLGAVVFDEAIDPFVILGGAVIVASVTYITWREAVLRKREKAELAEV